MNSILRISLLLFLSFSFSFVFCQKEKKQFFYADGTVSSEGTMENGKPNGFWTTYFETGIKKSEGKRTAFKLDSVWNFYNKYGNLVKQITYKEGIKNGIESTYHDSTCFLLKTENYVNGIKENNVTFYFNKSTKIIQQIIPFHQGLENGKSYEYDTSGTIITITNYKKGIITGKELINRYNRKKQKHESWVQFYAEMKIKESQYYKNGLLNGYLKKYDRKGKLVEALLYKDGKLVKDEQLQDIALRESFYNNGQVKTKGTYDVTGKNHGKLSYFTKDGKPSKSEIYEHGILIAEGLVDEKGFKQGEWKTYYLSGKLKSIGKYINSIKVEGWEYFFENGAIEQKGNYDNKGKFQGLWTWYYENKNVWRKENYIGGLEDGDYIEYDSLNNIITSGEFVEGIKEGEWFYELGDHKEIGVFQDGRKHGVWNYIYANGNLNYQGNFIDGEKDGKHVYYFSNGKKNREEYYEMGNKNGTFRVYNELGILVMSNLYEDNKLKKLDGAKLK